MFGDDKADHFGKCDLLMEVLSNVFVLNELEGVADFDTLSCVGGVGTNILTEAS